MSSDTTSDHLRHPKTGLIIIDITKHKQTEIALYKHTLEQKILLNVSQSITSTINLDTVLQIVSDGAAELLDIETTAIYLLDEEKLFYNLRRHSEGDVFTLCVCVIQCVCVCSCLCNS